MKIKLKETIIVEGKYDKITLDSVVDANIVTTDGFAIFKDTEKRQFLRMLAEKTGVIILTDSDTAGKKIRNHLKNCLAGIDDVKHIYIPKIFGKEKRKNIPSKEYLLGVEGINAEQLREIFTRFGITATVSDAERNKRLITRMNLYEDGFIGQSMSSKKRNLLSKKLNIPPISSSALLEVLNILVSYDEYTSLTRDINNIFD